jgi:hypothetical protein
MVELIASELPSAYASHMMELKSHLTFLHSVLEHGRVPQGIIDEAGLVAMHLRKVLELIAFSSLIANKDIYARAHADFSRHWNAKKLLTNLERLHPAFYPRPVRAIKRKDNQGFALRDIKRGYLNKTDFIQLYDICSRFIHVRNPFETYKRPQRSINAWTDLIWRLVRVHFLEFIDRPGIWLVDLGEIENTAVRVFRVEETE